MNLPRGAGKNGAARFGIVANGDYVIKVLAGEGVNGFRAMVRNIDAQLLHHGNRLLPHSRGLGPGAENIETIAGVVPQQTLGHLAAG
jgi:hypothetical protein